MYFDWFEQISKFNGEPPKDNPMSTCRQLPRLTHFCPEPELPRSNPSESLSWRQGGADTTAFKLLLIYKKKSIAESLPTPDRYWKSGLFCRFLPLTNLIGAWEDFCLRWHLLKSIAFR